MAVGRPLESGGRGCGVREFLAADGDGRDARPLPLLRLQVYAAMPRAFVAIEFHLVSVLDLTDGEVRRSLGSSKS